jgi:micrococcal nuclease
MTQKRRYVTVVALVILVCLGLMAYMRGWVKPVNPGKFMRSDVGSYKILEFVDGDTVIVDMGGQAEIVRFIGIDTPETHKPNTPVQCYGPAAAAYTKNRIGSQRIKLVADTLTTNRDRYERLLRYVYLEDGTNLNQELVAKGYAFAYAFPFAKSNEFARAMEQAQTAQAGLWGNCVAAQDPLTGQWHSPPTDPTLQP